MNIRINKWIFGGGWFAGIGGAAVVSATVAVIEFFRQLGVSVPDPQLVMALAITCAAAKGGRRDGLAGAAIGVAYAAYSLAMPGGIFQYDAVGAAGVMVNLVTLPAIALLVSGLKTRLGGQDARRADEGLRDGQRRLGDFTAAANDLLWECDRDCRFTWRHMAQGYTKTLADEDFYGKTYWDAYGEPEVNPSMGPLKRHLLLGKPFRDCEIEIAEIDGRRRFRRVSGNPFFDEHDEFAGFRGISTDITDEVDLRDLSGRLSARFESFIENSPMAIFLKDLDGRYQVVNRRFEQWYGLDRKDIIGKTVGQVFPGELAEKFLATDKEVLDSRQPVECERELDFADGTRRTVLITKFPVYDDKGAIQGLGSVSVDITEHQRAEQKLLESEDFLRAMADSSPVMISYFDRDRNVRFANRAFAARHGVEPHEMIGRNQSEFWAHTNRPEMNEMIERTLAGEVTSNEGQRFYPDGTTHYHVNSRSPHYDADGNVVGYFLVTQDRTDQKKAEDQLRHAQKMEAVGQLTGGIAHDFNNLLMVILGNAEILDKTSAGDGTRIEEIVRAAERGSELTQRLLAYSRRQSLNPQAVDMVALVSDMSEMLQRTLGESIEISTVAPSGIRPALADRGQLENAILNLAINARDAMPDGGKLTIECTNRSLDEDPAAEDDEALAGDFVAVAVSDTGTGMSAEIMEHVFEPFYTTKPVGEGSGLGLSMVYGFAKQSSGRAEIESQEGRGTTVTLYLPCAGHAARSVRETPARETPSGGGETILLIEDEDKVRAVAVLMLEGLGYRAIAVPDAVEAYQALAAERIDLVLSDVVLTGGVSGPEFAEEARVLYPKLRIIFMSGYPMTALIYNGYGSADNTLLKKPFRQKQLAEAVRTALDQDQGSAPAAPPPLAVQLPGTGDQDAQSSPPP